MKIKLNIIGVLVSLLMLSIVSCKKDETMVIASPSTPVNLTSSQQTLVLTQDNAAEKAVDLTWNKADFGYSSSIDYYLQVSYKDSSFSKFSSVGIGAGTTISYSVADLNTLLLGAKYVADEANKVQIRVLAQVADSLYAYSDTLTLTVTPYMAKRVINYPVLFVPGDYQGWSPDNEAIARLFSANSNQSYEGYLNLTADSNYIKFTTQNNWNGTNYGNGGKGILDSKAQDNLLIVGAGYYLIKADTKKLSWSSTLENWGIIGDAADGWGDGDDIMFDFDAENQVLTKTVVLKAGGLKFRANHKWDLNIGKGYKYGASDNITITTAGTYLITLDLRVPAEPLVTMSLQ